jgi:hypothetical protein
MHQTYLTESSALYQTGFGLMPFRFTMDLNWRRVERSRSLFFAVVELTPVPELTSGILHTMKPCSEYSHLSSMLLFLKRQPSV